MKHLIMCTAGHVDHGKTTLIRALTGIDCDTHPEEKRRGITINPGFAYLDLPFTDSADFCGHAPFRIGIVDVPGHQRFIHNMLAGACGVDFALLVIAADDGVMPQTREHLAILKLLGIKDGLIALTKADLATKDLIDLAYSDIRDAMRGSFLEDREIVPVSGTNGTGVDKLLAAIGRVAARVSARPLGSIFRMYIDRIFSAAGFGTIVTGSVMGGRVQIGDVLFALPKGTQVKVRRIERHGEEVSSAEAGERASLNISGLSREEFERGMLLTDRMLTATDLIDAEINVVDANAELGLYSNALFYCATHESACRIHLLDCDRAKSGQKALAQIELMRPTVIFPEDRFIVRNASADLTIGGGRAIDPKPLHHRRRGKPILDRVMRRASGGMIDSIISEVEKKITFVTATEIADALGCGEQAVMDALSNISDIRDILKIDIGGKAYLLGTAAQEKMTRSAREIVAAYHRDDPLGTKGLMPLEASSKLCLTKPHGAELAQGLLDAMVQKTILKRSEHGGFLISTFVPKVTSELNEAVGYVRERFMKAEMNVVLQNDLEQECRTKFKFTAKDLKMILAHLVEDGDLVQIDDAYIWKETVKKCEALLLRHLASNDGGITVAQFRDLINGNRKICLLMLCHFDREGLTRREGDLRFITDKGKTLIDS
jgi:selenocysteine-specific elongation factor